MGQNPSLFKNIGDLYRAIGLQGYSPNNCSAIAGVFGQSSRQHGLCFSVGLVTIGFGVPMYSLLCEQVTLRQSRRKRALSHPLPTLGVFDLPCRLNTFFCFQQPPHYVGDSLYLWQKAIPCVSGLSYAGLMCMLYVCLLFSDVELHQFYSDVLLLHHNEYT